MAGSAIKMEGTEIISEITLTVTFKKTTQLRMMLARWLFTMANWVVPFEITEDERSQL